jgi:hypothetical protein
VSLVLLLLWVADAWPEARDTRASPQRLAPLRWAMWRTWRRYFECVVAWHLCALLSTHAR